MLPSKRFLSVALLCALGLLLTARVLRSQGFNSAQNTLFTTTGTGLSIQQNALIHFHQLMWTASGTVTTCQVSIDSSPDGTAWTVGGILAAQTCTSTGASAVTTSVQANFIRVNVSTLSGGGTITIQYQGWASSPATASLPAGSGFIVGISSVYNTSTLNSSAVDIRWYFTNPYPNATQATSQDFGAVIAAGITAVGPGGQCIDLQGLNPIGTLYLTTNPFAGNGSLTQPCLINGNLTLVIGATIETAQGSFRWEGGTPPTLGAGGITIQPCNTSANCVGPGGITVAPFTPATACGVVATSTTNCWATGFPGTTLTQCPTGGECAGTITHTNANRNVTGVGTAWTSKMIGAFLISDCNNGAANTCSVPMGSNPVYVSARIQNVTSATTLVLEGNYQGTTASGQNYLVWYANTPLAICDGCLGTSGQKASTGHLWRNISVDNNGVNGLLGYFTRAVQEGTTYENNFYTLQQGAPTGASASGACAVWDNTLREASATGQTFTGHWFFRNGRCAVGQNTAGANSYGYVILGESILDGNVGQSSGAGPGFFEMGAIIGASTHRFQDNLYIDGIFDGRFYAGHVECALNDNIEVGAVNPVYGLIIDGVGSSCTLTNNVVEFHTGTSGSSARAISRPSGGKLLSDDNIVPSLIATSVNVTPSTWTLPEYIQAGNTGISMQAGGSLQGTWVQSNSGPVCAQANFGQSGWGTGAAFAVTTGNSQSCLFTITSGSASFTAAPTITFTFPTPAPNVPACNMTVQAITGTGGAILLNNTSISATAPVFTATTSTGAAFTPAASETYTILVRCGP